MMQTPIGQRQLTVVKNKITAVYQYLVAVQDEENCAKVRQLGQKLVNKEFAIAFCGHFSAGKSRMINCLIGEHLLPSSPIPTSANLVKVRAGAEEYVKVYFKDAKPRLYQAPYDYQLVKSYCKDGDQIKAIEICHADLELPKQTVILDTPGIDSADDAHRIATESAIHLADLIFYVMDYNHVQAELNFLFTKELIEAGKEVYLIINQVDKHSEQELSFDNFKQSVIESFAAWGVKPAAVFYTSLKETTHKYNEFAALQEFLANRLKDKDHLLLNSLEASLQKIVTDSLNKQIGKLRQAMKPLNDILAEITDEQRAVVVTDYRGLLEQEKALYGELATAKQYVAVELAKIMQNAYLMPFATRALAEEYLAACDNEFKVGFFFTKQKTLAERERRLAKFYENIVEKTKFQLEWHLRNFFVDFLKEQAIDKPELSRLVQNFQINFSAELLTKLVKEGARLSDAYVINYTDGVAKEIKLVAQASLQKINEDIYQELAAKNTAKCQVLATKRQRLQRYTDALRAIEEYEASAAAAQAKAAALLANDAAVIADSNTLYLFEKQAEEFEIIAGGLQVPSVAIEAKPSKTMAADNRKTQPIAPALGGLRETSQKLKGAAELVRTLPGFANIAAELQEKAARLANKGFTVALFGAFSAGKSSFANALLGERVLPVSPNPTTAAINKIKPIDCNHQHGMVNIKLKTPQIMLEDVNQALQIFAEKAASLTAAMGVIDKLTVASDQGAIAQTNYTFLQAFKRGYAYLSGKLGDILVTSIAEFSDYVAQEEKSCFVEWIDLYYDCPLTQLGITLVDTPGADSINARHTGVAFEFIKNADAILFVTYYNHAFSKADREFLIQLGRVKDSFHLDKMFFIINAIDLAEDNEEKAAVKEYVQDQLVKYGVKKPHLYQLSSLQALQAKQNNADLRTSGMFALEERFYQFITHDLADLAVVAAENELNRVSVLLDQLIMSSEEAADIKAEKRQNIVAEKDRLQLLFAQQNEQNLEIQLNQEIVELIYYIKQRVFLRFNDFFKESFNPTVLRDDGRDLKVALHRALAEFLGQLGFDFSQEMRATTVRLDCFAQKIIADYQQGLVLKNQQINPGLSFTLFEWESKTDIDFVAAFQELPSDLFSKALSTFKNPKNFFEKNDSKIMREALEEILSSEADKYLRNEQNRLQEHYDRITAEQFAKLIDQMHEQTADFYLGLLSALDGGLVTADLVKIRAALRETYC